jgi:hypothetical protein
MRKSMPLPRPSPAARHLAVIAGIAMACAAAGGVLFGTSIYALMLVIDAAAVALPRWWWVWGVAALGGAALGWVNDGAPEPGSFATIAGVSLASAFVVSRAGIGWRRRTWRDRVAGSLAFAVVFPVFPGMIAKLAWASVEATRLCRFADRHGSRRAILERAEALGLRLIWDRGNEVIFIEGFAFGRSLCRVTFDGDRAVGTERSGLD